MEKEPQPESMSTVTIKQEYAPSEYSSEPPPAYVKPKSASVQVARIVAVTVVVTSIVLGGFILASAYVSANAACRQFEDELELLAEAADRLQPVPQPEALVQDERSAHHSKRSSPNSIDDDAKGGPASSEEEEDEGEESTSSSSSSSGEEEDQLRAKPQFDLAQLAAHLLDKHQKTKMNCVVEKKRAEEVVDHKPKTVRLPFGVNLTTDPRLEVRSGERMVIVCESGTVRSVPQPQEARRQAEEDDASSSSSSSSSSDQEGDDDDDEGTIMIQPVMIPIPQTRYETHMNQRMPPPPPPPQAQPQFVQIQFQPQPEQPQQQPQQQQQQPDFPPNPILRHIVQQIIAQKVMEAQRAREEQMMMMQQQQQQQQQQQEEVPRMPPHRFQVVAPPQPQPQQQQQPLPQQQQQQPQQYAQRFPLPEEVLTQLNRLPNRDVIVAVSSESDSSEDGGAPQRMVPQEIRLVPQQAQAVTMMRAQQQQQQELPLAPPYGFEGVERQAQAQRAPVQDDDGDDESRPHFVQPRSVEV